MMGIQEGFYSFWSKLVLRVVFSLLSKPDSLKVSYIFCLKIIESAISDILFFKLSNYYLNNITVLYGSVPHDLNRLQYFSLKPMSATTAPANPEHMALLKFGIAVPPQHRQEVLKLIKTSPQYKEEFEHIRNSLNTMINEDDFLEAITSSHTKIAEISENSKVIIKRDTTFQIRAIDPEHIASLTERAFFNSFNLERIILNDLQEQNTRKIVENREEERTNVKQKPQKEIKRSQNDDEDKCICGKTIPDSLWIMCNNENKCRGSGWYHSKCAGIEANEEEINHMEFVCQYCKRGHVNQEKDSESSQKKFKFNDK